MAKAERLIQLINLFKERSALALSEMSEACGVSERTVYRDLRTLSRMNIPTHNDCRGSYRLDPDRDFALADMGVDEVELIRYSLRNNPLVNYSFFGQKLNLIEKKILDRTGGKLKRDSKSLFILEQADGRAASVAGSDILARFARATLTGRKVVIRFKGADPTRKLFLPVAIKITRSGPFLVIASGADEPSIVVGVREVVDLAVSTKRCGRSTAARWRRRSRPRKTS